MSTNEIATYAEKVHETFPQIPVVEIVTLWHEQRSIPISETEFFNTNLTNISDSEMVDFIFKEHEKFPENSLMDMFIIWAVMKHTPKACQYIYIYIQGVTGGMCETSGECSLC